MLVRMCVVPLAMPVVQVGQFIYDKPSGRRPDLILQ